MKKGQLFEYDQEIKRWQADGSVLMLFHRSKIADFYKAHQITIDRIIQEILEFQAMFYQMENGQVKFQDNKPVMLEGKTDQEAQKFYMELMHQDAPQSIKLIAP